MKISHRTVAVVVFSALLFCLLVQRGNSLNESIPLRIKAHPTEPGVTILSWKSEEEREYEVYWSAGPVSEDMVWTKVEDPTITTEGQWMKWADDGSKTGGLPVGERYYMVLLLENRPPNQPEGVVINETDPTTEVDLTCTLTPADPPDPDAGDTVTYEYKWAAGEKEVVHGPTTDLTDTLTADNTAKGEAWTVTVTPNDGKQDGPTVTSDPVTIKNTPPKALSASIFPDPGYEDTPLTIEVLGWEDPDAMDVERYKYQWKKGGIDIHGPTEATLTGDHFDKGDSISCEVTPWDGADAGKPLMTQFVGIQNTPPAPPTVAIDVSATSRLLDGNPDNDSDLICKVTKASPDDDIDGDAVVYKYEWLRDGIPFRTVTKADLSDTIPSTSTSVGETWLCIVTPNDGEVDGKSVSDSVQIMNGLPSASGLSISPASPITGDDLTAAYSYSDPDGDSEDVDKREMRWYRNAQVVESLNDEMTVPSAQTAKDDTWYFRIRVHDGEEYSNYAQSQSVEIGNTAPIVTNAHIEPTDPTSWQDLTAAYGDFSDADGDSEEDSEIRWYISGVEQSDYNDQKVVPSSDTERNQVWNFTLRPKDGTDYGTLKISPDVTIRNARPEAQNVGLAADPSPATRVSTLTASYHYFDLDYVAPHDSVPAVDPENEGGRSVEWYKNGDKVLTKNGAGSDTLVLGTEYTDTYKGDTWYAKVSVHDTHENGPFGQSPAITLENFLPVAQSPYITPASPLTTDDLVAHYTYYDADKRKVDDTEIDYEDKSKREVRWYKDGAPQDAYDDQMSVPSSATSKDEKWHFEIRVHDDSSYGPVATSGDVTIGNSTPEITNPAVSPGTPISANDLTAGYFWLDDDDDDTETGTEYRWYKDGILFTTQVGDPPQTDVYDQKVVTSDYTARGDRWRFTVRASDGTVYSNWAFSGEVTIVNAKPSAMNVRIEPSPAITTDTLQAKYKWSDQDTGDTEVGTEIRWYRKPDGADDFSEWGMGASVPSSATAKGDQWYMKVKPRDSYGEFGSEVTSGITDVDNAAPTATVNPIAPSDPVKGDSLSCSYTYNDADGDAEDGDKTEINWYRDGSSVYKTGYKNTADILTVPADVILKGEVWKFGVKPHDGTTLGSEASKSVTVGNTPPSADDAKVTPEDPKTGDDLNATYTFNDPDDDSESGTEIRWFKDGANQPALNNFTKVDSSLTTEGETWYFKVKPNDGTDWGTEVTSASATIGNTAPTASNLSVTPAQAGQTIAGSYTWSDPDPADSETGSKIEWFRKLKDEAEFSSFKQVTSDTPGALQVTAGNKGDKWYLTVEPYDGQDYGGKQTSPTVTVGNSPPTASGLTIGPPSPKAGEKITGDYSYADVDGDNEDGSIMTWYRKPKGGSFGIVASGTTTAGATGGIKETTATGRDEQWYFTVKPMDGNLYGQEYQSAIVTVVNSAPDKPKIELSPDVPASTQNILCTITEYGDADGDTLNFEYLWENGGGPFSRIKSATTDTLSGGVTNEGETWQCRVRASDGLAVSDWSDAKTVRVNVVPSITGANIVADPSPATANSTLTATAVGWSDAFGGSEGYDYQWLNNGNPIGGAPNQNTLTGPWFSRENKVSCKITANDGIQTGNFQTTAQLDISNAKPTADPATIKPDPARTTDTLTGDHHYYDGDDDVEGGTTLQWFVNGNPITLPGDDPQNVLPSGYTARGDVVVFQVTPKDGTDFGPPAAAQVTIRNTPPESRNVSLAAVKKGETLTANYTYYDADGDAEGATQYRWYRNNELQAAYNDSATATAGARGEQWYYTVLPHDGTDYGALKVSNAIIVLNTAPVLDSVTIGPDPAYVSSTFKATPGAASDNDGDDITFLFQWQKKPEGGDWGNIGGATSNTLAGVFQKGDGIRCVARPHDGIESGSSVTSNAVTVSNSAPSVSNVLISPSEPISTNNLTAIPHGFSDPDGDEESGSLIKWYVNDVDSGLTGKTLPSSATSEGEQWHFTMRPGDGTDLGAEKTSGKVTIGNSPPAATNPHVEPTSPQSDDTLTAVYNYADPDADAEAGTQVQWYRNGSPFRTDTINAGQQSQIAAGDVLAGHRWFFTARAKDGEDFGTIVSSGEVTVGNTPPVASNQHIEPASPKTTDNLEAKYKYLDADGDTESGTEIRWYKDGDHQGAYDNSKTVPSSATSKSQWWHFTVKPKDGIHFGTQLQSGAVHIDNSPPVATVNPIRPSDPVKGTSLSCSYGYSDADDDDEDGGNTVITWYRNGAVYKTGNKNTADILTILADVVVKDEVWKLGVQAHDGTELGPEGSASVTIRNQPPSASDVAIDPGRPIAGDALNATYDWSDPDEPLDSESGSRIRWYANGVEQAAYRDLPTVPPLRTVAGEDWFFTVEPSDGTAYGAIQVSPTVTINRPPTQPAIAISPDVPKAKTNLTCTVTTASTDADGDTVKYEYRWSTTGKEVVHGPKEGLSDVLVVTGGEKDTTLVKGETWTCMVTPTDSLENGTPAYDFVDVVNTPPVITDADIVPDPAYTNTDLSLAITASDDDNDAISYSYQWRKGGADISGETGTTLSFDKFVKGDSIDCIITPHDNEEAGPPFRTAPQAISNSAPSKPSVDVTPNSPGSGDDLKCTVSGSVDPDGDAIEYEYQWFQNGNPLTPVVKNETTDTVPSSNTSKDDIWTCVVTPIDVPGGARGDSESDSVTIQ